MNNSLAAKAGLGVGAFYVAIGVLGFFASGFDGFTQNGPDKLLGVSVNPFHNIAHLGIGAILIILSLQKNEAATEGAVMGIGLFYITAFIIGVMAAGNLSILSVYKVGEVANFFHLVSGVTLLGVGLLSTAASASAAKRSGVA